MMVIMLLDPRVQPMKEKIRLPPRKFAFKLGHYTSIELGVALKEITSLLSPASQFKNYMVRPKQKMRN